MAALGIVIFAVGLLFSIAWHELGHLLTAKMFGVKVTQYMVGFGRTLFSVRRGDTEYGIKAIPLGGYIRMIGMLPPGKDGVAVEGSTSPWRRMMEDARRQSLSEVSPEDADRLFYTRAPWQRTIVMFAGPFMNLILAIALFTVVLMGFGAVREAPVIGQVSDCVIPVSQDTGVSEPACPAGAAPTPAKAAGFVAGDEVVSFNGTRPADGRQLRELIRRARGTAVVVVKRSGADVTLRPTIIVTERRDLDNPAKTAQVGFLGTGLVQRIEKFSATEAFAYEGQLFGTSIDALLALPQKIPPLWGAIFHGDKRSLDSPIGIVGASRLGGEVLTVEAPASQRIASMLGLVAGFNMSLFLFNMLPLLPLDGGHIAGALWEALRRRLARLRHRPDPGPFDVAKLMPAAYVVAAVFLAFTALVLAADIVNPVSIRG
jgi:membrane-associated protease RseP (regulator of RpoE activity)